MKKIFLPILLLGIGSGAGIGAGVLFGEDDSGSGTDQALVCPHPTDEHSLDEVLKNPDPDEVNQAEYAKLENQFVVPILVDDRVSALVVLTINIEVPLGGKDIVLLAEPKLRDKFLQVLFEHANLGGFSGNFTSSNNMRILREDLLAAARRVIGSNARDILIIDIVRQES